MGRAGAIDDVGRIAQSDDLEAAVSSLCREVLVKRVAEVLVFGMDFSQLLAEEETLSSVDPITVRGGTGLDVGAGSVSGSQVLFEISEGASGQVYEIIVTVATSTGNTREAAGLLQCE